MKTVRNIREPLKKPRPLKSTSSSDQIKFHLQDPKDAVIHKSKTDILSDLEILNMSISNCNFDEVTAADISRMCAILKKRGEDLDSTHKESVDRYFCTLRNASREERMDMISRLKLLEVIEMRAMGWKTNENLSNYYNMKILDLEQGVERINVSGNISPSIPYPVQNQNLSTTTGIQLAPGEILKSSGKFAKPTKIAGKNYFKDEIVIRNSDSGKVMGIKGRRVHMIEELSDTVISFQRVNPGARDRLVQITGPHEESIGHAKLLVEDTIRRNASPVRENMDLSEVDVGNKDYSEFGALHSTFDNQNSFKKHLAHSYSMGDASFREHSLPVQLGQDLITISGTKLDLLKTARLVLTEYFAGQTELLEKKHENPPSLRRSTESNMQRFDLTKQVSSRNISVNSFQLSHNSKRESASSFSSSDDDVEKGDACIANERINAVQELPLHVSVLNAANDKKNQASFPVVSADKFTRSSSVPNDYMSFGNFHQSILPSDEEGSFPTSPLLPASVDAPPIPPPSYKKQPYTREFLLNCANSPFSHKQPAEYAHIHQNFREIICQSPVMFDPIKYQEAKPEEMSNVSR